MKILIRLILIANLVVGPSAFSAGENKQQEGEGLIDRAIQLSNIRSVGAQSFRLEANFKLFGDDGVATTGTYKEVWSSRAKWRRDITNGSFQREEGGGDKTRWTLDLAKVSPARIDELERVMEMDPIYLRPIKIVAVRDQSTLGAPAKCVELKGSLGKQTIYIDSRNGQLLQDESTTSAEQKYKYSCQYDRYETFGGHMYPRHLLCMEGPRPILDIDVTQLLPNPSLDSVSFVPPAGATELANCAGKLELPKALTTPDPEYPTGQKQPSWPVVLRVAIGRDGSPRDIKIARSSGDAFDTSAVGAVSRWNFKPAMCDGDPVPVRINIEVWFRPR